MEGHRVTDATKAADERRGWPRSSLRTGSSKISNATRQRTPNARVDRPRGRATREPAGVRTGRRVHRGGAAGRARSSRRRGPPSARALRAATRSSTTTATTTSGLIPGAAAIRRRATTANASSTRGAPTRRRARDAAVARAFTMARDRARFDQPLPRRDTRCE